MNTEQTDAIAKLEAIAKLPEKWRKENVMGCGFYASELEAALAPLPADKWAAEKAALVNGKEIEWRYLKPNRVSWCDWKACPSPIWITDGTAEYRIAPSPSPADKSDKELGEIGAKAALATGVSCGCVCCNPKAGDSWEADQPARSAFACAVREAVEKECYDPLSLTAEARNAKQAEEIARLTAELAELEGKYMGMCNRLQECVQTHKLGLGGEKIDKLVVEAVANLTSELAKANAELERYTKEYGALIVEHSKLQAELERMRRPMAIASVMLSKQMGVGLQTSQSLHFRERITSKDEMRGIAIESALKLKPGFSVDAVLVEIINPPPAPTVDQIERSKFEEAHKGEILADKESNWRTWKLAKHD